MLLAIVFARCSQRRLQRLTPVLLITGVAAVVLSSTPIPYWLYGISLAATMLWFLSRRHEQRRNRTAVICAVTLCSVMLAEVPRHFSPRLKPVSSRSMTVIGDSVTAGMGRDDSAERWTQILQREHGVQIQDLSHMGETAASALTRVRNQGIRGSLLVLEIGGNDLLGPAPSSTAFADDLEALLSHVVSADRQVVMFELPLPPLYHEFGRVQRQAAQKFGVQLIPRRQFLSVLAADDATLDSIHLSGAGHRRMADCVWRVIGPAFQSETGGVR